MFCRILKLPNYIRVSVVWGKKALLFVMMTNNASFKIVNWNKINEAF